MVLSDEMQLLYDDLSPDARALFEFYLTRMSNENVMRKMGWHHIKVRQVKEELRLKYAMFVAPTLNLKKAIYGT